MTNNGGLFVPSLFRRDRPPTPNPLGEEEGLGSRFDFTDIQQQQGRSDGFKMTISSPYSTYQKLEIKRHLHSRM